MELREAARKSGGRRVRLMHLAPERLAAFYGAGQVLRLASEVVAWSPAGVAPDGEVLTTRTRKALEHIQVAPVQESSEAGLLLQVRDAFEDTDRPHALLGQFVNLVGQQRSLHQQKARMAELAALLPEEAQAPIQARQDQLAQQSSEAESAVEKASAEIATRLPGLFQVFSFVHSLPGLSDREKTALFRSLGVILQFVTILVPSIAAYGIQRLASNTIEDFLLDEDEGHDPNNPFILEKKPAQRSEEDWRWLEQNTSSLREAAQISGYSRNTVKGYFERHKLLDVSE